LPLAAAGPEVAVVAGGALPAPGRLLVVEVPAGAARVVAVVPGAGRVVAVVPGAAVDGVVTIVGPVVEDGAGALVATVAGAALARVAEESLDPRRLLKLPPARIPPFPGLRGTEPANCVVPRRDPSSLRTTSATTPIVTFRATASDSRRIS
jgi:hypothetical protein